jgi:hypothetical protein
LDFLDRLRNTGYPKALVAETGNSFGGIQCRIGHVIDGFVGHQVFPHFLDGPEQCLLVRFVARQGFHEEGNSMLVRDKGNDELFEI